jgi:hypothetical protein
VGARMIQDIGKVAKAHPSYRLRLALASSGSRHLLAISAKRISPKQR